MTTSDADFKELVGLYFEQAEAVVRKDGYSLRPVKVNGSHCMITRDYRTNRINVEVVDEKITAVTGVG